ncbi:MAG: phosphoadenosine phosphosulfate reductase family protein [Dehalococcoidia bacterium]
MLGLAYIPAHAWLNARGWPGEYIDIKSHQYVFTMPGFFFVNSLLCGLVVSHTTIAQEEFNMPKKRVPGPSDRPDLKNVRNFVIAVSGGKDSTAAWLWCKKYVQPQRAITPVFCDTQSEWPETYKYIDYLQERMSEPVVTISESSLEAVVQRYGWWPDAKMRVCTEILKRRPLAKYLTKTAARRSDTVVVMGLRADESKGRAARGELFFESHLRVWVWSPLFHWSTEDVLAFLASEGVEPNPVYQWVKRVGCGVCPLSKPREAAQFIAHHPDTAQKYLDLESSIGSSWRQRVSLKDVSQYAVKERLLPADEECAGNGCYTCEVY